MLEVRRSRIGDLSGLDLEKQRKLWNYQVIVSMFTNQDV